MKRSIITMIMLILFSFILIGCSAQGPKVPDDDSHLVDVLRANITLGNAIQKEINEIDIVRQLSTQIYGYDSQSSLYIELSSEDYQEHISSHDVSDAYYITLIFSNDNKTKFEVFNDGTIIKLKNEKRYICQVLTDYDFIQGLYHFNESIKNHLTYDKVNVSQFYERFGTAFETSPGETEYSIENCYRIYSHDLLIDNTYQVFKFANNCATFLLYNDAIYELGPWFGGLGVVDIKIADINNDGFDEVYFTNSWGSGVHWNGLSYFDTKDQHIYQLYAEKRHYQELMLTGGHSGIIVSRAYFSSSANNTFAFIDLTLTQKGELGVIHYNEEIIFDVFDN